MAEVVLWQYRWTNPGDDTNVQPSMLEWKEVTPRNPHMQTMEQRIEELRSFRYNGKPVYEVRALGVIADGVAPSQAPSITDEELSRRFTRCAYPGPNPMYRCNTCGAEEFGVRNLLVKHARACGVSVDRHQPDSTANANGQDKG